MEDVYEIPQHDADDDGFPYRCFGSNTVISDFDHTTGLASCPECGATGLAVVLIAG